MELFLFIVGGLVLNYLLGACWWAWYDKSGEFQEGLVMLPWFVRFPVYSVWLLIFGWVICWKIQEWYDRRKWKKNVLH